MTKPNGNPEDSPKNPPTIGTLSVAGFKSISDEQTLEVRPLTLLAGANSSGKSSMMQPLLLLKQTLEAPYDPGPLLLTGPNVKFTSARQFHPSGSAANRGPEFLVRVGTTSETRFTVSFGSDNPKKMLAINLFSADPALNFFEFLVSPLSSAVEQ